MSFTMQQKKALYWGMGILAGVLLMNLAWAQIHLAVAHCFAGF